jgi:hypothetical protein
LEQFTSNLWVMKQNPVLFNANKIDKLIKLLQAEFFQDEHFDWRLNSGLESKNNFIMWTVTLLRETHWEITNPREVIIKALKEINDLKVD